MQFIVYGQHQQLGEYLLKRVKAVANTSTRSTQNTGIETMIKKYGFKVIVPPYQDKTLIYKILISYKKNISTYLQLDDLLSINDI